MKIRLVGCGVFAGLSALGACQYTVPLDSLNLGGQEYIEAGPTLTFDNVGGSGVDVSFLQSTDLRAYNLYDYGGPQWTGPGTVGLIDMPWDTFNNPLGTNITFSSPVSDFSLSAGDFGIDDDTPLEIQAYDIHGNLLGTATAPWGDAQFPPFATLTLDDANISRIHYSSGGPFQSSTFFNQVTFSAPTPSPEPATVFLAGVGLATAIRRRQQRKV